MQGHLPISGTLQIKRQPAPHCPLSWTIRNRARPNFITGWLMVHVARAFSRLTGIPTITSQLSLRLRHAGTWTDYGIVGYRVVTSAGVNFLVDDWTDSTTAITNMKYHGVGTGTTAENATDTAIETESTTVLNPDSTRATGTMTQPSANIQQSVGTLTFDGSAAITEHGICSAASGAYSLWDRTVFSAVNVVSGDSIQFTYQCTLTAGS